MTLAVQQMYVSSTGEEIKKMITEKLHTVGVILEQIYFIATDNRANVEKSCKLLSKVA